MTSSSTNNPIQLGIFSNLGLSATQTQQIQSIVGKAQNGQTPFSQVLSQVEALLTPAQQSTFKSDLQTLTTGANLRHHHHGGGAESASSALSQMLSGSSTNALGASSSTGSKSNLTTDAFGNPVSTPGSALADVFGVTSVSNMRGSGAFNSTGTVAGSSAASNFTNNTPNASNVTSPFSAIAAQFQVQGQLAASSMDNFFT